MDLQYLLWLQGLRESLSGALDSFFLLVSQLGKAELPMAVTLIVYWCFSREVGQRLLFCLNGSDLFNNVLKLSCCVYRPWVRETAIHPVEKALSTATGYSFPSGHSSKAGAFFGSLGIAGKKRRWVPWACGAVILLVMFSRNYLGVHTPQDVLTGAAVGLLCAFLLPCLLRWTEKGQNRDLLAAGIGAALCGLSVWYVLAKSYPADLAADGSLLVDPVKMQKDFFLSAGAVLGMLAGWPCSIWSACTRCCLLGSRKNSGMELRPEQRDKTIDMKCRTARTGFQSGGLCYIRPPRFFRWRIPARRPAAAPPDPVPAA